MRRYWGLLCIVFVGLLQFSSFAVAQDYVFDYGYKLPPPPPEPTGLIYLGLGANYAANNRADFDSLDQDDERLGLDQDKFFRERNVTNEKGRLTNDLGFNLFLGYQFNPFFGLEGFFDYYGNQNFRIRSRIQDESFAGDVVLNSSDISRQRRITTNDAYIIGLVGTGSIPVFSWLSLFTKLGMGYYHANFNIKETESLPPEAIVEEEPVTAEATDETDAAPVSDFIVLSNQSFEFSGFALVYGAGLQFFLGPKFSIRAEYDGYVTSDSTPARIVLPNQIALSLIYLLV